MSDVLLRLAHVSGGPLRDVTVEVRAGELVGLVGPAGCGKSTGLRVASGAQRPTAGTVTIAGHAAASRAARRVSGYAAATPVFPPGLSVRGVLEYYAWFHGPAASARARVATAVEAAALGEFAARRPALLPYGVLRRVALAQAMLGERRLLLLDETLDGAEPALRRAIGERLGRLVWNGGAVILATHDFTILERLADRILVLRAGRIALDAPASALLRERILEVVLDAPPAVPPPGFRPAAFGIEADLGGQTVEAALALCRAHRLVVRATRVRSKSLADVVVQTNGGS